MYYQLDARYYIYLFEWNFGVHTAVSMFIFMSVSSLQQSLCPCGQHNWGRAPSPHHPRKIQSLDNRVIWHLLQLQWLKDPRALGSISRHISLLSTRSRQRQDGYLRVPQIDPSVSQPVVQSWRRPLLGPSPGWKHLLALSHLRHYEDTMLNRHWPCIDPTVGRCEGEVGTHTQ